ncbi:tetrapyrrole methylase [Melampsora americana]|nr:tetrapyrrole methylase [Melampsora americana]
MFFLIGLGLSSPEDITLAGLKAIKSSERVYLESYTSLLMESSVSELESLYGKPIQIADRDMVETQSDKILERAGVENVSFLVVGDPFGATTHTDLLLRCKENGIQYKTFHNASILNAIGATGLSLYNFGQTVSVPFFDGNWKPTSWVDRLLDNLELGLHTLLLLDIKVKEQSEENLARGRKIYEPPRFMSVPTAISQLMISIEPTPDLTDDNDSENNETLVESTADSKMPLDRRPRRTIDPDITLGISVSRVGSNTQAFHAGTLTQLINLEEVEGKTFGAPLHSLIIIGQRLNPIERDYIAQFAIDGSDWHRITSELYHLE